MFTVALVYAASIKLHSADKVVAGSLVDEVLRAVLETAVAWTAVLGAFRALGSSTLAVFTTVASSEGYVMTVLLDACELDIG